MMMCDNCDWESAVKNCDELLSRIEELPERGDDFASNCQGTVEGIQIWIEDNEHITDAQEVALENIDHALERWRV